MSGGQAHDGARPGPVTERRPGPQGPATPLPFVQEQAPVSAEMAEVSRRIAHAASPGGPAAPPPRSASARGGLSPRQVMALQRSVGNRAVATIMRSVAQRVADQGGHAGPRRSTTRSGAGGQATARPFGDASRPVRDDPQRRHRRDGLGPHQVPEPDPQQRRPERSWCRAGHTPAGRAHGSTDGDPGIRSAPRMGDRMSRPAASRTGTAISPWWARSGT